MVFVTILGRVLGALCRIHRHLGAEVTMLAYRSDKSTSNVYLSCKWDVARLGLRVHVVLITLLLLDLWYVPQLRMSYSHGSPGSHRC
jgi:hypothetical protein